MEDGTTVIACSRGDTRCRVKGCHRRFEVLCDYPVTRNGRIGTCDRKVCRQHAWVVGDDRDFCDRHAGLPDPDGPPDTAAQLELF
jgi:hypothetical protein